MPDIDPDPDAPAAPTTEASVTEELAAMRRLHTALSALDRAAQVRVLVWLADRYNVVREVAPMYGGEAS